MSRSPLQDKHLSYIDYMYDPTWQVFRIMAEFVEGFSFLGTLQRTVTVFGSARIREGDRYYEASRELAGMLARRGFTVVTGGGPGVMEAANRGAFEASAPSIGLNVQLPHEQQTNRYVTRSESFDYFFSRKVMLDASAQAYIFFPGGFGTLDELFEILTLIQTGKMDPPVPPVYLIGVEFWTPLMEWMRSTLLERFQTISAEDLQMWTLTDDPQLVVDSIEKHIEQKDQTPPRTSGTIQPPTKKPNPS